MTASPRRRPPLLVLVGGFLGAGKTTLLSAAIQRLHRSGVRCAAIVNDQGQNSVDLQSIAKLHSPAFEIAGGCFCCQYQEFESVLLSLASAEIDVIFAEPTGSCADLASTVVRPMLARNGDCLRLAPLTVLVDPQRQGELNSSESSLPLRYLFNLQIEEADLICFTKSDMCREALPFAGRPSLQISAATGDGVDRWLQLVMSGEITPGQRLLSIDYAMYAEAEAALAWLNFAGGLDLAVPTTPAEVVGPLLESIGNKFTKQGIELAHMKCADAAGSSYLKAAVVGLESEPRVEGDLLVSGTSKHQITLNVRAEGTPAAVQAIVEEALAQFAGTWISYTLTSFSPGEPRPQYRM